MGITTIRQKLHEFIDTIENKKAEAIYTLFENEIDLELLRKKLILNERKKFLNKVGKSYSWNQVKEMAINKDRRHAL